MVGATGIEPVTPLDVNEPLALCGDAGLKNLSKINCLNRQLFLQTLGKHPENAAERDQIGPAFTDGKPALTGRGKNDQRPQLEARGSSNLVDISKAWNDHSKVSPGCDTHVWTRTQFGII
jgi:hypothetical protein